MLTDSVQNMEYTITTPLLFASILASVSPTVPTAMVQWSFACLVGSHLLCIPVMYMSHMAISMKKKATDSTSYVAIGLAHAVAILLVACAFLQLIGLSIQGIFFVRSFEFYGVSDLMQAVFWMFMVLQIMFVICVTITSLMAIITVCFNQKVAPYDTAVEIFSWMYTVLNFLVKIAVVSMLASAAERKTFPVLSCNVWQGGFAFW